MTSLVFCAEILLLKRVKNSEGSVLSRSTKSLDHNAMCVPLAPFLLSLAFTRMHLSGLDFSLGVVHRPQPWTLGRAPSFFLFPRCRCGKVEAYWSTPDVLFVQDSCHVSCTSSTLSLSLIFLMVCSGDVKKSSR